MIFRIATAVLACLVIAVDAGAAIPMRTEATARQADGKILAAGQSTAPASVRSITIIRYLADGALDTTFGNGGAIDVAAESSAIMEFRVTAVAGAPDGGVFVATVYDAQIALVRLTPDGQPDPSFGNSGPGLAVDALSNAGHRVGALSATAAGTLMAFGSYAGPETSGVRNAAVYRYDAQGERDPTFAPNGERLHALSPSDNEFRAVLALEDGSYVAVGSGHDGVTRQFAIAKILPIGDLDPAFGTNGRTLRQLTAAIDSEALAITRESLYGNFFVVGRMLGSFVTTTYSAIAMFTPTGQADPGFLANGFNGSDGGNSSALSVEAIPGGTDLLIGSAITNAYGWKQFVVTPYDVAYPGWPRGYLGGPLGNLGQASALLTGAYAVGAEQYLVVGTRYSFETGAETAYRARHFYYELDTDFPVEGEDAVPNIFNFSGESGAMPSRTYSSSRRITGINVPVPVTVEGGAYAIGCEGPPTTAPGIIANGQTVCVYTTSAATPLTATTTILTVGGVQGAHTITTGTVPDTILTVKPTNPSAGTAKFEYRYATSQVGGLITYECSLDGAAFTACPALNGISYNGLAEGEHTFQARASNAWGTDPTPAAHTWLVVGIPDTVINSAPPMSPTLSGTTATFTFSSPSAGVTAFECQRDGAGYSPCTSPKTYSGLTAGPHVFKVRARTFAGVDPTPAATPWMVDATPPDTTITSPPPTSTTVTFTFIASEAGATFECQLDTEPYVPCTSPHTYFDLVRKSHSFRVRALDAVGNADPTPAQRAWNAR